MKVESQQLLLAKLMLMRELGQYAFDNKFI
jgi:hypothetical protein